MASGYPSGSNTFVPDHDASQALVVGYSRNPKTFRISAYSQYVNAKKSIGLYLQWISQEAARILTPDDAEHLWNDGDAAPMGNPHLSPMAWQSFITQRRAFPFTIGHRAADQADFPLTAAYSADSAQAAMTSRTLRTHTNLQNTSWGNNTAAVNGGLLPSGQDWTTGNTGEGSNIGPNIKKSIQYGERLIHLQTIGVVTPIKTALVVNPFTAQHMAASTEIQEYIKRDEFALAQLRGDKPSQNGKWGLPDMLYGHPVEVEDAVLINTRPNSPNFTATPSYVMPNGIAYLIARDGDLQGIEGTRSFSTIQIFFYNDEMTVETFDDVNNRRYQGRVVTDDAPVVVSPISGFYFTAVCPSSGT